MAKRRLVDIKADPDVGTMRLFMMPDGWVNIACGTYVARYQPNGQTQVPEWKEILFEHAKKVFLIEKQREKK